MSKKVDIHTVPFIKFIIDLILILNLVYFGLFIVDHYLLHLNVILNLPLVVLFIKNYNPFYISAVGIACVVLLKTIGIARDYTNTTLILMTICLILSFIFRW